MNSPAKLFMGLLASAILISACKTQKDVVFEAPVIIEEDVLDTLVVSAPVFEEEEIPNELPVYRASATRKHDLIHTKLDISFDWQNQYVLGKAELTLKPYFYATDELELDAKVFDIHNITMNGQKLEYDYDFSTLKIKLDKVYNRDETYTVFIDYTAKPNEGPSGGSAAITSDKGLFFIDPLDENQNKPSQIWTQGETENSSRWFPTIDKPNERCSQEIYLTVDQKYQTLSNGVLVSSTKNDDGTRTDYWKQDKPHAPYLFMVGVGEYAVVTEAWNEMPLMYYVEPEFKNDAKKIFNHTPEMLDFFSDRLGYAYPWDKYAQIVCRDYVSGAMENTGAVVFGEFVQKNSREFIDSNNDDIVAHEMFHHWFGDLVTCESWSNLTLNEGFATYSEYMWREYKYGKDNAEKKRLGDLNGYLMSSGQSGVHDLIDFEYGNKEEMFDAHSYNKGGLIVHMLRSYVGDEAFYASLNKYLNDNQYTDVEAHELRLAFEDVVGEDLNWFFNQWFYDQGHPILEIDYDVDAESSVLKIDVSQVQDVESNPAIFKLPTTAAVYYKSGKVGYFDLVMDQRNQTFEITVPEGEEVAVAVFDGKHDLLSINKEQRSEEEYVNLFLMSEEYEDRINAIKNLKGTPNFNRIAEVALKTGSSEIRSQIVNYVDAKNEASTLVDLAKGDENSAVRALALRKLGDYDLAVNRIEKDSSFWVISEALSVIAREDNSAAVDYADKLVASYHKPLINKIAEIYANTGKTEYLDFFESNIDKVDLFGFFNYINQYSKLANTVTDNDRLIKTAKVLQDIAMDGSSNYFKKYSSTNFIRNLVSELESRDSEGDLQEEISTLKSMITQIINASTDKRLRSSFQEYIQP